MYPKTMKSFEECFQRAAELNKKYIGVLIHMEGFPGNELIINKSENFNLKLDYYKSVYNDHLKHRRAKGISIVGVAFGDTLNEIEKLFQML